MSREFDRKDLRYQCVRGPDRAYYGVILQKFPVLSLFNREFGGDGFARDCLAVLRDAIGQRADDITAYRSPYTGRLETWLEFTVIS